MKKIKLAVVCTNYPSKFKSKYVFVHSRVKEYIKNNFEVRVFTRKEWGLNKYNYEGVKVYCGNIFKTIKNIFKFNPDIIISHAPNPRFSSYINLFMRPKFKVISWFHGNEIMRKIIEENHIMTFGKILINSICLRFDTVQVAVSEWMKRTAANDCFLNPKKIVVIPNLVDEDEFEFKKRSFEKRKLKIISLRDLAPKYGLDVGIKALNEIEIPFVWDIYGIGYDKKYMNYLKKIVKNKNIHIYKKRFPHKKIPNLYANYDLFLAPSRREAQGVAMVEAMMTGMPVVTTNIGGIPEFVEHGGFISELDPKGIKKNVKKFYRLTSNQKKQMAKKARKEAIKTSSYEQTIQKEINLIKKIFKK